LVDAASVNGYVRPGDQFSKSVTVNALLAEASAQRRHCAPARAAFGESLYVYALATNGYGRSSGLDSPSLRAFAITPA
jgi:hypothetical protein